MRSETVQLRLLGGIDLTQTDGTQARAVLAQPKRLALLVYLALNAAVYYLRNALGHDVILSRGDEDLAVDPERVWCDAVAFEQALDAGRAEEALDVTSLGFEYWRDWILDIEIVFSRGIAQIVMSGFPLRCGALEADLFPRCRVFSDQRTDGVEDRSELPVVSFLEPVEAPHEVRAARDHLPQPDERSHDLHVDLHGAPAAKHAGQHRHALLGERAKRFPGTAPT